MTVDTTKTTFRGLVIGGPADGSMVDCEKPWFIAAKSAAGVNMLMAGDSFKTGTDITYVRYDHTVIPVAGVQFGFWVRDGAGKTQAPGKYDAYSEWLHIMRQLVTNYERKKG